MKIKKLWIFKLTFQLFVFSFLSSLWIQFIPEMTNSDMPKNLIIIFSCLVVLGLIVIFMSFLTTYTKDPKYYTKYPVPLSKFKVDMYKKFYVLTYNGDSWLMHINDQRPLLEKSISMTNTYNRKKDIVDIYPNINFKNMEY